MERVHRAFMLQHGNKKFQQTWFWQTWINQHWQEQAVCETHNNRPIQTKWWPGPIPLARPPEKGPQSSESRLWWPRWPKI